MPYYQNVFDSEFIGVLLLADRQLSLNFRVRGNINTSMEMVAWNREPYNLTGNRTLTINYSFDSGEHYTALAIDVGTAASSIAAVTCREISTALNADTTFAELFEATIVSDPRVGNFLKIRALKPREKWKCYISNTSAESIVRFNKKAGVAELPSYFSRHTISNMASFDDSVGMLIELSDPVAGVDVNIVTDAGLDSGTVRDDWELLEGRSGLFTFKKQTVDGSSRITQIIEYPAGAVEGDLAKKTKMTYTAAQTEPDQITEIPYVLQSSDLVTP